MRLSIVQQQAIKETFLLFFEQHDRLWLFGSRADDTKRGGDIDLYAEVHNTDITAIAILKIKFLAKLKTIIGNQKIDFVINILSENIMLPIYSEARSTGVRIL